jgi:hypothetical protein
MAHAPDHSVLMRQATHVFRVETRGRGLVEVTREIGERVSAQQLAAGLLTVFCRHTSASLLQENAAAAVRQDLEADACQSSHDDLGAVGGRWRGLTPGTARDEMRRKLHSGLAADVFARYNC